MESLEVFRRVERPAFVHIDEWRACNDEDRIFTEIKGAIIAPMYKFFRNVKPGNSIDYFYMNVRGCYNSDTGLDKDGNTKYGFREHLVNYLNYFEKYYDTDHQLLKIYAYFKTYIDGIYQFNGSYIPYDINTFMNDLYKYIISDEANPILHYNLRRMNRDNYIMMTSAKKDTRNPCLEYKDIHAELLMLASLYQKFMIPLVSHFMYVNKTPSTEIRVVLLQAFDKIYAMIMHKYGVNLYAKLYETIMANIGKSSTRDRDLWEMQATRGINPDIHGINTLESVIMNAIPKYVYTKSVVCFNFNIITKEIKYKITDIAFEYKLSPVFSSIRDEDNNSQTDKFESHMIKQNEALSIQYKVNSSTTMKKIAQMYGPFPPDEIAFYRKTLTAGGKTVKSVFQQYLLNYIFMKEFGDVESIRYVNNDEYIMLMIAAKKILKNYGIFILADIIGGRCERIISRKSINKAMMIRMKMSENYNLVLEKYKSEEIIEQTLFGFAAQAMASEFSYIDYYNPHIHGKRIEVNKDVICEEFLKYALLI